jgi:hypothetical protein
LLNLYQNYMQDIANSPIRRVADGILFRAGWHTLLHGYNFTKEYPWFVDAIRQAQMSTRYQATLPQQMLVKVAAKISPKLFCR